MDITKQCPSHIYLCSIKLRCQKHIQANARVTALQIHKGKSHNAHETNNFGNLTMSIRSGKRITYASPAIH